MCEKKAKEWHVLKIDRRVQCHKIKAPPRATVARAMAPLRKGTCSWTTPLVELGVEAEEVELLAAGDVEVVPEFVDPANVRYKKKGCAGTRVCTYRIHTATAAVLRQTAGRQSCNSH